MKVIVCPTDFSHHSVAAARYAADLAGMLNMKLCLVHVCPLPVTIAEIPLPPYPFDHTIEEAHQHLDSLRNELAVRTGGRINIDTECRQGFFIPELTAFCETLKPYAVVIGSEEATGLERFVSGASTFAAITKLRWPVIVVPQEAVFSGIGKIALACDLQDVVHSLPEKEIVTLVKEFHAELHVLHIGGDGQSFSPDLVAESGLLQEMLSQLDPEYHFIEGDNVEQGIMDFLASRDFDMLFIFPKHRHLLDSIFHRSHSKRLVMQAHIPVAALHERND